MTKDVPGEQPRRVLEDRRVWVTPEITTLNAGDAELSPTGGGSDGYGGIGS